MPEEEIQRSMTAPKQPDADERGTVYLPGLLSNEFGVSAQEALNLCKNNTVEVDGEPLTGDKVDVPLEKIEGKAIAIVSDFRHFRFKYEPQE